MLLSEAPVNVMIRITNHDTTRAFYKDTLGLKHIDLGPNIPAIFEAGNGTRIIAYTGEPTHPAHTVGAFTVSDIQKTVTELKDKGVVFEEYDLPDIELKTVDGIATSAGNKSAWFKDPDGYIWAINQM